MTWVLIVPVPGHCILVTFTCKIEYFLYSTLNNKKDRCGQYWNYHYVVASVYNCFGRYRYIEVNLYSDSNKLNGYCATTSADIPSSNGEFVDRMVITVDIITR